MFAQRPRFLVTADGNPPLFRWTLWTRCHPVFHYNEFTSLVADVVPPHAPMTCSLPVPPTPGLLFKTEGGPGGGRHPFVAGRAL